MSAAATAKAKHTDLWMVVCVARGFHTVRGWSHSADFALLFTKPEVDQFISKQADEVLLPIHYDPRVAHNNTIRVIGQKTESAEIHHDLDKVALAAVNELESRRDTSDLRVEVVGGHGRQHSVAVDPKHVAALAIRTLHNHAVRSINAEPAEYVRRFDVALERYDRAFEAYRDRVQGAHRR